jgi:hypothetical protein
MEDEIAAIRFSEIAELRISCYRHRKRFHEILTQEGFSRFKGSTVHGERFRRVFIRAVMKNYPEGYIRHIRERICLGCAFEASGPRCYEWAEQAVRAICRDEPTPPRIVKHWTEQKA